MEYVYYEKDKMRKEKYGEIIEESVKDGIIPYTFFVDTIPTEYAFLDSEGNEIQ